MNNSTSKKVLHAIPALVAHFWCLGIHSHLKSAQTMDGAAADYYGLDHLFPRFG